MVLSSIVDQSLNRGLSITRLQCEVASDHSVAIEGADCVGTNRGSPRWLYPLETEDRGSDLYPGNVGRCQGSWSNEVE